jgi:hypothetical protein
VYKRQDYRGKRLPLGENREYFPNFFYDKETCLKSVFYQQETISEFKIKKNSFLFEFSINNIFKLYDDDRLSESNLKLLDMFIGHTKSEDFVDFIDSKSLYIKPNLFLDGTILKREIAKMILNLGFNGWICFKDLNLFTWNTCIQNEICKELVPYKSEIMLSFWNNFLDITL